MNQAYMRFLEQLLPGYERSGGDADEARRFIEYADARTRSAGTPDTWREPGVPEFARALGRGEHESETYVWDDREGMWVLAPDDED